MPWSPNAVVKIDGTAFTSSTIEGITISMGRIDLDQQSQAGYARIAIKDLAASAVKINSEIVVKIDNYSNVPTTIYTGFVTDILTSVLDAGGSNVAFVTDIIATGALSKLAVKEANTSGYPEQLDGDRMLEVITGAFGLAWEDLPTTQIWSDYLIETWDDLLGVDVSYIDTPGTYTLFATTAEPENAYSYAETVATSGFGQLFETVDGNIGYADQDHRADYLSANGFLDISKNFILSDGIGVSTSRNNIVNDAIVTYGDPESSVQTIDPDSIELYGRIAANTTTFLKNQTDAETFADRQILLNSSPEPVIEGIGIQIDAPTMNSTLLNGLVGIFFGLPISITNFPSGLYPNQFFGYCEGWTWTINRFEARLDINVSDVKFSAVPVAWQDVYAGETWATIDPSLQWLNALLGVN